MDKTITPTTISIRHKNDPLVKLAYENIQPLEYWNSIKWIPRYWTITTERTHRRVCVIYDNFNNAYAFEYTRYPWEFVGNIYGWDWTDLPNRKDLIAWLNDNV